MTDKPNSSEPDPLVVMGQAAAGAADASRTAAQRAVDASLVNLLTGHLKGQQQDGS